MTLAKNLPSAPPNHDLPPTAWPGWRVIASVYAWSRHLEFLSVWNLRPGVDQWINALEHIEFWRQFVWHLK